MPIPPNSSGTSDEHDEPLPQALHDAVSAFKRELIRETLHRYRGNRSRAAAALGIERTSLLRLIRELCLEKVPRAQSGRPRPEGDARKPPP